MSVTLYLASSTDRALSHALDTLHATQQANPLQPAYLLLPDRRTIRQVAWQLGSSVGIYLVEFYRLAEQIVAESGQLLTPLSATASQRLLRYLLQEMAREGALTTFAPVHTQPGFVQQVGEWVREMKGQAIPPQALAAAPINEHERQLAHLYGRYQNLLQQQGWVDGEGLLWCAVTTLESDPTLFARAAPCLLLGFDQLSPLQLRLLERLATRLPALTLYLHWDERRAPESLALTRLRATREAIEAALAPVIRPLPDPVARGPAPLPHLQRHLFERAAPTPGHALQAVAAPSQEAEVRAALRRIKRLLLAGCAPEQIALLTPEPERYRVVVAAVAAEYGLPLAVEAPLTDSPVIASLLDLLQLAPDFPWRATIDALHSPYSRQPWLDKTQLAQLARLTRAHPTTAGLAQWREALHHARVDEAERAELAALEGALFAFFSHLTPPAQASYRDYALWIQRALLGLFTEAGSDSLHLVACCQEGPYADRELPALQLFFQSLHTLVEAAELLPIGEGEVGWARFRSELAGILAARRYNSQPGPRAVHFGPLEMGRALPIDHLLLLGLGEGAIPRPPQPDPFYSTHERQHHPLPVQRISPAEQASLWWQVISHSRQSLTLFRSRLDAKGVPWLPSPYWSHTLALVEELAVEEPPLTPAPEPAEAASRGELLLALARIGARQVPTPLQATWAAVRASYEVLAQRASPAAPGPFEGLLQAPDLRAELAERYGPRHGWSPSQLNRYHRCPYGFFAREVLQLEAQADPQAGLDARLWGILLHALLESLHRCLAEQGLRLIPEHLGSILTALARCCAQLLHQAPARYGFRPTALWSYEQAELQRLLAALLRWECEATDQERFRPFRQEVRFGLEYAALPRLLLNDREGVPFALQGIIDRIDLDEAGRARLIDYKSGGKGYSEADIEAGLALQSALYALVAEGMAEIRQVEMSYYLHIPTQTQSGKLTFEGTVREHPSVQAALTQAGRAVAWTRQGYFPSAPRDPICMAGCEYAALCRVSPQSRHKGWGGEEGQ